MESIISTVLPYISPAALPLVVVVIAFIYIQSKRKEVGKKRDEYEVLTNYRLDMLEKNQGSLTESIKELQNAIVNLQISVNSLIIEIKNLKENE
jgi:hypothetical protein